MYKLHLFILAQITSSEERFDANGSYVCGLATDDEQSFAGENAKFEAETRLRCCRKQGTRLKEEPCKDASVKEQKRRLDGYTCKTYFKNDDDPTYYCGTNGYITAAKRVCPGTCNLCPGKCRNTEAKMLPYFLGPSYGSCQKYFLKRGSKYCNGNLAYMHCRNFCGLCVVPQESSSICLFGSVNRIKRSCATADQECARSHGGQYELCTTETRQQEYCENSGATYWYRMNTLKGDWFRHWINGVTVNLHALCKGSKSCRHSLCTDEKYLQFPYKIQTNFLRFGGVTFGDSPITTSDPWISVSENTYRVTFQSFFAQAEVRNFYVSILNLGSDVKAALVFGKKMGSNPKSKLDLSFTHSKQEGLTISASNCFWNMNFLFPNSKLFQAVAWFLPSNCRIPNDAFSSLLTPVNEAIIAHYKNPSPRGFTVSGQMPWYAFNFNSDFMRSVSSLGKLASAKKDWHLQDFITLAAETQVYPPKEGDQFCSHFSHAPWKRLPFDVFVQKEGLQAALKGLSITQFLDSGAGSEFETRATIEFTSLELSLPVRIRASKSMAGDLVEVSHPLEFETTLRVRVRRPKLDLQLNALLDEEALWWNSVLALGSSSSSSSSTDDAGSLHCLARVIMDASGGRMGFHLPILELGIYDFDIAISPVTSVGGGEDDVARTSPLVENFKVVLFDKLVPLLKDKLKLIEYGNETGSGTLKRWIHDQLNEVFTTRFSGKNTRKCPAADTPKNAFITSIPMNGLIWAGIQDYIKPNRKPEPQEGNTHVVKLEGTSLEEKIYLRVSHDHLNTVRECRTLNDCKSMNFPIPSDVPPGRLLRLSDQASMLDLLRQGEDAHKRSTSVFEAASEKMRAMLTELSSRAEGAKLPAALLSVLNRVTNSDAVASVMGGKMDIKEITLRKLVPDQFHVLDFLSDIEGSTKLGLKEGSIDILVNVSTGNGANRLPAAFSIHVLDLVISLQSLLVINTHNLLTLFHPALHCFARALGQTFSYSTSSNAWRKNASWSGFQLVSSSFNLGSLTLDIPKETMKTFPPLMQSQLRIVQQHLPVVLSYALKRIVENRNALAWVNAKMNMSMDTVRALSTPSSCSARAPPLSLKHRSIPSDVGPIRSLEGVTLVVETLTSLLNAPHSPFQATKMLYVPEDGFYSLSILSTSTRALQGFTLSMDVRLKQLEGLKEVDFPRFASPTSAEMEGTARMENLRTKVELEIKLECDQGGLGVLNNCIIHRVYDIRLIAKQLVAHIQALLYANKSRLRKATSGIAKLACYANIFQFPVDNDRNIPTVELSQIQLLDVKDVELNIVSTLRGREAEQDRKKDDMLQSLFSYAVSSIEQFAFPLVSSLIPYLLSNSTVRTLILKYVTQVSNESISQAIHDAALPATSAEDDDDHNEPYCTPFKFVRNNDLIEKAAQTYYVDYDAINFTSDTTPITRFFSDLGAEVINRASVNALLESPGVGHAIRHNLLPQELVLFDSSDTNDLLRVSLEGISLRGKSGAYLQLSHILGHVRDFSFTGNIAVGTEPTNVELRFVMRGFVVAGDVSYITLTVDMAKAAEVSTYLTALFDKTQIEDEESAEQLKHEVSTASTFCTLAQKLALVKEGEKGQPWVLTDSFSFQVLLKVLISSISLEIHDKDRHPVHIFAHGESKKLIPLPEAFSQTMNTLLSSIADTTHEWTRKQLARLCGVDDDEESGGRKVTISSSSHESERNSWEIINLEDMEILGLLETVSRQWTATVSNYFKRRVSDVANKNQWGKDLSNNAFSSLFPGYNFTFTKVLIHGFDNLEFKHTEMFKVLQDSKVRFAFETRKVDPAGEDISIESTISNPFGKDVSIEFDFSHTNLSVELEILVPKKDWESITESRPADMWKYVRITSLIIDADYSKLSLQLDKHFSLEHDESASAPRSRELSSSSSSSSSSTDGGQLPLFTKNCISLILRGIAQYIAIVPLNHGIASVARNDPLKAMSTSGPRTPSPQEWVGNFRWSEFGLLQWVDSIATEVLGTGNPTIPFSLNAFVEYPYHHQRIFTVPTHWDHIPLFKNIPNMNVEAHMNNAAIFSWDAPGEYQIQGYRQVPLNDDVSSGETIASIVTALDEESFSLRYPLPDLGLDVGDRLLQIHVGPDNTALVPEANKWIVPQSFGSRPELQTFLVKAKKPTSLTFASKWKSTLNFKLDQVFNGIADINSVTIRRLKDSLDEFRLPLRASNADVVMNTKRVDESDHSNMYYGIHDQAHMSSLPTCSLEEPCKTRAFVEQSTMSDRRVMSVEKSVTFGEYVEIKLLEEAYMVEGCRFFAGNGVFVPHRRSSSSTSSEDTDSMLFNYKNWVLHKNPEGQWTVSGTFKGKHFQESLNLRVVKAMSEDGEQSFSMSLFEGMGLRYEKKNTMEAVISIWEVGKGTPRTLSTGFFSGFRIKYEDTGHVKVDILDQDTDEVVLTERILYANERTPNERTTNENGSTTTPAHNASGGKDEKEDKSSWTTKKKISLFSPVVQIESNNTAVEMSSPVDVKWNTLGVRDTELGMNLSMKDFELTIDGRFSFHGLGPNAGPPTSSNVTLSIGLADLSLECGMIVEVYKNITKQISTSTENFGPISDFSCQVAHLGNLTALHTLQMGGVLRHLILSVDGVKNTFQFFDPEARYVEIDTREKVKIPLSAPWTKCIGKYVKDAQGIYTQTCVSPGECAHSSEQQYHCTLDIESGSIRTGARSMSLGSVGLQVRERLIAQDMERLMNHSLMSWFIDSQVKPQLNRAITSGIDNKGVINNGGCADMPMETTNEILSDVMMYLALVLCIIGSLVCLMSTVSLIRVKCSRFLSRIPESDTLAGHPKVPRFIGIGLPLLILGTIALFISSNSSVGATVNVLMQTSDGAAKNKTLIEGVFAFSLVGSVREMFAAGSYFLGALILIFSGIFPYIKLLLLLYIWVTPGKYLSHISRTRITHVIDIASKWSLIDVVVMVIFMTCFRMEISPPTGNSTKEAIVIVAVSPTYGFNSFLFAVFLSLFIGHIVVTYNERVGAYQFAAPRPDSEEEDAGAAAQETDASKKRGRLRAASLSTFELPDLPLFTDSKGSRVRRRLVAGEYVRDLLSEFEAAKRLEDADADAGDDPKVRAHEEERHPENDYNCHRPSDISGDPDPSSTVSNETTAYLIRRRTSEIKKRGTHFCGIIWRSYRRVEFYVLPVLLFFILVLTTVSIYVPNCHLKFGGFVGFLTSPDDKAMSIARSSLSSSGAGIAYNSRADEDIPIGFDIVVLEILFLFFSVISTLMVIIAMILLWMTPMQPKWWVRMMPILELFQVICAYDVYALSVIAGMTQIGRLVEFIVGHKLDLADKVVAQIWSDRMAPYIVKIEPELEWGAYLIAVVAVLNIFTMTRVSYLLSVAAKHYSKVGAMSGIKKLNEGVAMA